jgi:hypothetical protein
MGFTDQRTKYTTVIYCVPNTYIAYTYCFRQSFVIFCLQDFLIQINNAAIISYVYGTYMAGARKILFIFTACSA